MAATARSLALIAFLLPLVTCNDERTVSPEPKLIDVQPASVTSSQVQLQVPPSMATSPFNTPRFLTVPTNFTIAVYTRIPGARFLAATPDGNLLVSRPGAGTISLVRPNPNGDPLVSSYATGLARPHDLVFYTAGATTYLYVAEKHRVIRYTWTNGNLTAPGLQVIVSGLPDASTPGLGGNYGHELKNIAISPAGKLYVSIASTCNVCASDDNATPVRASIHEYNTDGTGGRLFARGLRNAEGLAILPGTNTLWVVVNNRDNIAYPFHSDFNGDGSDDYGKVMQGYVDDHPPEEFTSVRDGGNYGWPYCNPNPNSPSGLVNMPLDLDVQTNASGAKNCGTMDRVSRGIQAHSAPLGLLFLQNTAFPTTFRNSAVAALHGSWNRSSNVGYKVVYFPWDAATQQPTGEADLVSGFATASSSWGRPVDVAVDAQGSMFISDDAAGAVYKLTQQTAPPPPSNTQYEAENATLVRMRIRAEQPGYTGTGYVRFQQNSGSYVQWTINVATAGTYTLAFRYTNGSSGTVVALRVNGVLVSSGFALPMTATLSSWTNATAQVTLNAGNNTVRLTSANSRAPNIDNVTVQ